MSTQQDIYAAGSENRLPMLNKDRYVPWSIRLLCYAKCKPNGKLIVKSIFEGPHTNDELTATEAKQVEADDQAIQTILMGFLKTYMLQMRKQSCSMNWGGLRLQKGNRLCHTPKISEYNSNRGRVTS
ncbi:hypothetical protein Tco_0262433 [Tanacetum coccineum]